MFLWLTCIETVFEIFLKNICVKTSCILKVKVEETLRHKREVFPCLIANEMWKVITVIINIITSFSFQCMNSSIFNFLMPTVFYILS